ncbi:MAG: nucleotidyltransferase domain-containing protein [Candidatus Cloacimonetes bacterium]|nr:nucleotidyltransferase domain-containing protein [Candidatus Cloacimonadota bacterium]
MEILEVTRSKIRSDLLRLFFSNPGKRYYLRQLESFLDYSVGSLRRELLNLTQAEILISNKEANLVYYSLNLKHPLYNELKKIIFKTLGVEGSLKELLKKTPRIKSAFIYGSFAQKREKMHSDVDLMVIGKPNIAKLTEEIATLGKKLDREINFIVYPGEEFEEKKKAGGFLEYVLKEPRIILIQNEEKT